MPLTPLCERVHERGLEGSAFGPIASRMCAASTAFPTNASPMMVFIDSHSFLWARLFDAIRGSFIRKIASTCKLDRGSETRGRRDHSLDSMF